MGTAINTTESAASLDFCCMRFGVLLPKGQCKRDSKHCYNEQPSLKSRHCFACFNNTCNLTHVGHSDTAAPRAKPKPMMRVPPLHRTNSQISWLAVLWIKSESCQSHLCFNGTAPHASICRMHPTLLGVTGVKAAAAETTNPCWTGAASTSSSREAELRAGLSGSAGELVLDIMGSA